MRLSSVLVAGVALSAGVEAQPGFDLGTWLTGFFNNLQNGNSPNWWLPKKPTAPGPGPGPTPGPPGNNKPGPLWNPWIPVGRTQTESATSYGNIPSIVIPAPTKPNVRPTSSTSTTTQATTTTTVSTTSAGGAAPTGANNSTTGGGPPGGPPGGNGPPPPPPTLSNQTAGYSNISSVDSCALDAKRYPNARNDPTHRCNWNGADYNINTDWEEDWPETGKTVYYTLVVTNGTNAPQGDPKMAFLINGQSPGPLIRANWGDWLEITVVNQLSVNGTSFHWHGFFQNSWAQNDGVPGVTQCPIAPGQSMTYRFQATQYGTSWYHSHFSDQYSEGIVGPIIIDGPTSANYDIDLGTVMLSDYYPLSGYQEAWFARRFGPPDATNYLLNGMNAKVDGSGGKRFQTTFQAGKRHKIRLINSGVDHHFKFQIDQHDLIVVAMDFVPIKPYRTSEIALAVGQRYDIIVVANQKPGSYWMRALYSGDCSRGANNGLGSIANGIVSYGGWQDWGLPTSQPTVQHWNGCADEPYNYLQPIVSKDVDRSAFDQNVQNLDINIDIIRTENDTLFAWNIGGISQVIDWNQPTLGKAAVQDNNYDPKRHVITLPNPNVWTYWIVQNLFFVPHAIHLHGHDFRLLGTGQGTFDKSSNMGSLNFTAPPRRDTMTLRAQSWNLIAFKTDNPGPWLMHCHMAWHVGEGLSLQFLERPNEAPGIYGKFVNGPTYQNTCKSWLKYASSAVYPQYDSGLRKRMFVGEAELEMEMLETLPEPRGLDTGIGHNLRNREHLRRHAQHWGTQAY